MISSAVDSPFDDGPIRAQLIGTWSYPNAEEPSGFTYLHFHENGVAFQFVYSSQYPERRFPMRLKYSLESSARLHVRNIKSDQAGWTIGYQLEGDTLSLLDLQRTHVCARIAPAEVPEWFREAMAKYLLETVK